MSTVRKHWREQPVWSGALAASAFFVFYLYTLAPGVLWGDDAKFQLHSYLLQITADELGHPLYVAIGHLFAQLPLGNVAWRINLASAVLSACAVFFLFMAGYELTQDAGASWAAAIALGVSHTFWSFAVRPQAQALNAFFVALLSWRALRWRGELAQLFGWSSLFGVGLTNHFLLAFSLPGLAWLIAMRARRECIALYKLLPSLVCIGLGFLPFILIGLAQGTTGRSLGVSSVLIGLLTINTPVKDIALWGGFLAYNFVGVAFLLALIGIGGLWRRARAVCVGLLLLYVVNAGFVFDLDLPDQYKYYIPSYIALSLFVAPGYVALRHWLRARSLDDRRLAGGIVAALLLTPLLAYHITPQVLRGAGVNSLLDVRNLPGRDALTFFLQPSKHEYDGAEQFARAALAQAAPHAVLAGDHTLLAPLRFIMMSESARDDIALVELLPGADQAEPLRAIARERPVYLVDVQKYYDMGSIEKIFRVEPVGVLYRLTPRE